MDEDISDDQQDIARGRNMVDSKFQGGFGLGGTHVSSFPIARVPPPRTFNRRRGRASALPAPARTAHKLRLSPSKNTVGVHAKSLQPKVAHHRRIQLTIASPSMLKQNAVMSSSDYISDGFKDVSNMTDEASRSPRASWTSFASKCQEPLDLPKIKVPLILGVGGKGQGKTFQSMLIFKKLGVSPIVMSAGELESGNAGEPAKLIRQRYREASDIIKKGRMSTSSSTISTPVPDAWAVPPVHRQQPDGERHPDEPGG